MGLQKAEAEVSIQYDTMSFMSSSTNFCDTSYCLHNYKRFCSKFQGESAPFLLELVPGKFRVLIYQATEVKNSKIDAGHIT